MLQTNAIESEWLNADDCQLFEKARTALDVIQKRTFEMWVVIGHAVVRAKEIADERGGRNTFRRLLDQQGLSAVAGDKASVSRLLRIMANLPEVEQWRLTLTPRQQVEWAAPNTVYKHCPIFSKQCDDGDNPAPAEPKLAAVTILKRQAEESARKIAHLEEQLAAADAGSLFDLRRDTPASIADTIVRNVSGSRAREIARCITAALSKASVHAAKAKVVN